MSLTSRRGSKPFMKSTGNNFRSFFDNALGLFFLAVRQSKQACFAFTRCVSFGPTYATCSARPSLSGLTEQLIKIERIVQMMNARTINAALSFVNIFITIILLFVIFNSNYQVNDLNIILSAGRYLVGLQHRIIHRRLNLA